MTTQKRTTPTQGQPADGGNKVDRRAMFRKLAVGLMRLADETPGANIRHTLKGGLKLVVRRTASGYALGAWRQNVPPSAEEIEVCRDCFAIPADAMQSTLQRHRPPIDRTKSVVPCDELWLGYAMDWSARKVSAPALPGVEPTARP